MSAWLARQKWKVASTAKDNPHSYCLKREMNPPNKRMFELVVLHIREYGYLQRWWGHTYVQYASGGHHHWTMGESLEVTKLINRKTDAQHEADKRSGKGSR